MMTLGVGTFEVSRQLVQLPSSRGPVLGFGGKDLAEEFVGQPGADQCAFGVTDVETRDESVPAGG